MVRFTASYEKDPHSWRLNPVNSKSVKRHGQPVICRWLVLWSLLTGASKKMKWLCINTNEAFLVKRPLNLNLNCDYCGDELKWNWFLKHGLYPGLYSKSNVSQLKRFQKYRTLIIFNCFFSPLGRNPCLFDVLVSFVL